MLSLLLSSLPRSTPSQEYTALLGDLGGTNSRLYLCHIHNGHTTCLLQKTYDAHQHASLQDVMSVFLQEEQIKGEFLPKVAVVACAGPVQDNSQCKMSNLSWPTICCESLQKALNIPKVFLLNDFEAVGYSLVDPSTLDQATLINSLDFKDQSIQQHQTISVFGPGTGLGTCQLIYSNNGYQVACSEGGHVMFSAVEQQQWEYKQYLAKIHANDYVSCEQAFCGPAIQHIYAFLGGQQTLTNQQIVSQGVQEQDHICQQVVSFLLNMMATEISNIAVRSLCYSGVYVVGNIARALLPYLLRHPQQFLASYYNKPQMKHVLTRIPVYFLAEEELGLRGAQVFAKAHK